MKLKNKIKQNKGNKITPHPSIKEKKIIIILKNRSNSSVHTSLD